MLSTLSYFHDIYNDIGLCFINIITNSNEDFLFEIQFLLLDCYDEIIILWLLKSCLI